MHPILFHFGHITLYTYGLFVALGFFAGSMYISYGAKKMNPQIISQDELYSLLFYTVIFALVGARLLFIITEFREYAAAPLNVFKVWEGGLVYYGGFIAALLCVIIYTWRKKISILALGDIFAPALALGHFFGRIGCFFAGCCYGKSCELPWTVVFNNPDTLAARGIPLHPTQLYEAFCNIVLFVLLYRYNKKPHANGLTIAFYLIAYALFRFTIEFFRGDDRGAQFLGLSISQAVSIVILLIGIFLFYKRSNSGKVKSEE
ncbi:MAG: prolipoprotein diacylglyceryl transferase [Endomicrobia bacterium]|nr:prolipoprotein diacylglyceryl transferase [Endomicrobiia bacterium]